MQKWIDRLLALVLLGTMFVIGGVTVAKNAKSLAYAVTARYTQYLTGEGIFDGVSARIASFTNSLNQMLLGKTELQKANAQLQLLIGKEMLSYGDNTMVKLKTGQLYDLMGDVDVSKDLDKLSEMRDSLSEMGIPMLFVYEHSMLYADNMLPDGATDYNGKVADEIVSGLGERGIPVLDSREVLKATGLPVGELVYNTDQHWSIRSAFAMFGAVVERLNGEMGLGLDESVCPLDRYDIEVFPRRHMGAVGERVGDAAVVPDDFTLITPKFDTFIRQSIQSTEGMVEREGTFAEAVLNMGEMERDIDGKYGNCYDTYGYHAEFVRYVNESAPDRRILVVKDSFGTPVTSFLSLAAREVIAIDLRKTRRTALSYAEEYQPDVVVVMHCQEMMRGKNFVFVD